MDIRSCAIRCMAPQVPYCKDRTDRTLRVTKGGNWVKELTIDTYTGRIPGTRKEIYGMVLTEDSFLFVLAALMFEMICGVGGAWAPIKMLCAPRKCII